MDLHLLAPDRYARVVPLLDELDIHLAARAVVECDMPGTVYVDDPAAPRAALIRTGHRLHLAGDPNTPGLVDGLRALLQDTIYPQGRAAGESLVVLHYGRPEWEPAIDLFLAGQEPIRDLRHYYAFDAAREALPPGWRDRVPPGMTLRPVDRALLAQEGLEHLAHLREEMASECPSDEFFLDHRFGVCLVYEAALAGWCLSEYNCPGRCEVGIETTAPYRRRGLGTVLTWALIDAALARGHERVGWHCWASNLASVATAQRAGLRREAEYAVYVAFFDPVLNLAVHGDLCLSDERHALALDWYQRAFAAGEPPAWAWANAGAARAGLGDTAGALEDIGRAIDLGFDDRDYFATSPRFDGLRQAPGWAELLARLDR